MLALILTTKSDVPRDFSKSTLIGNYSSSPTSIVLLHKYAVAPLSVLSNWEKQVEDHCAPGSLTTCIYYGNTRSMSSEELRKYDVVVTTYQTVAGEHNDAPKDGPSKKKKKTEQALFNIQWKVNRTHWSG
jgi:SWI/SNF-related matrix-associated actin-dependent regulator of chromatin subfamily A3